MNILYKFGKETIPVFTNPIHLLKGKCLPRMSSKFWYREMSFALHQTLTDLFLRAFLPIKCL